MDETHYSLLGVDIDASTDEISRAFRNLARVYHPDRAKSALSMLMNPKDRPLKKRRTGMFQKICEARDVLMDTEKRSQYNRKVFGQEHRKWRGSEARAFEDEFYHDMQTSTTKSHAEKPPPIVVRKSIPLTQWMALRRRDALSKDEKDAKASHYSKLLVEVQFRRTSICSECHGYTKLPFHSRKKHAAIRVIPWEWDPQKYTEECYTCAGSGSTLFETSLLAKQSKSGGESSTYNTEAAYSTTITAQICACETCGGRKRIFKQKVDGRVLRTSDCHHCDGSGLVCDEDSLVMLEDIPIPRHFDATTMTSIVVLLEQGHQRLPNQCKGDVHVVFDLCIPKAMEIGVNTYNLKVHEEEEEENTITIEDHLPTGLTEGSSLDVHQTRKVPMKLEPTRDGRHFKTECLITLKEAMCMFSLEIPTYWKIPLRALLTQSIGTSNKERMAEFLRELDDLDVHHCYHKFHGQITWTGDTWNITNGGPCLCEYCHMPPFVFPDTQSPRDEQPKVLGRYPGFAPCLFVRRNPEEGWAYYGCAVSPQRYTAHPENAHISLIEPSAKIDYEESKTWGKLDVLFKVERPPDHGSIPPMVYESFLWCCEKLGI